MERTQNAVAELLMHLPTDRLVWGGDWNHALSGLACQQQGGRDVILKCLSRLDLEVPAAHAPHRIEGLLSIDHIAVPSDWKIASMARVVADAQGRRLSNYGAYVVDAAPPPCSTRSHSGPYATSRRAVVLTPAQVSAPLGSPR